VVKIGQRYHVADEVDIAVNCMRGRVEAAQANLAEALETWLSKLPRRTQIVRNAAAEAARQAAEAQVVVELLVRAGGGAGRSRGTAYRDQRRDRRCRQPQRGRPRGLTRWLSRGTRPRRLCMIWSAQPHGKHRKHLPGPQGTRRSRLPH
jgi:hypothetical protein